MSDLIERLRQVWSNDNCTHEAADEIERLTADNEHLRKVRSVQHGRVARLQAKVEALESVLSRIADKFDEIAVIAEEADSKPSIKFDDDHVFDRNDLPAHVTSPDCWCGPVKDTECESLWIHNHSSRVNTVEQGESDGGTA